MKDGLITRIKILCTQKVDAEFFCPQDVVIGMRFLEKRRQGKITAAIATTRTPRLKTLIRLAILYDGGNQEGV